MSELTSIDQRHLARAIALAAEARAAGDEPFGAVLADTDGQARHEHRNTQNTEADPSAHAELNVLRHLPDSLRGAVLDGMTIYASGEPCPMCAALMFQCGIQRVVFAVSAARVRELTGKTNSAHLALTCATVMSSGNRPTKVIGPVETDASERIFQ